MKLNPVGPNQTEVTTAKGTVFFSYQTPVAARVNGRYYRTEKTWSNTTSRHVNAWLGNNTATTKPQTWFDKLGQGA